MKKNLLFIVFILTVQSLFADEGVVYWGTPAWDKKTASFEISPREAEKYFFSWLLSEISDSIKKHQPIRQPFALWCIYEEDYIFSTVRSPCPREWGLVGIGVNGYTGVVRFVRKPEVRVWPVQVDPTPETYLMELCPFPSRAFAFVHFSKKDIYRLLKKAFPEASKEDLKKSTLAEWKCLEENRKFVKEAQEASRELKKYTDD